MTTAQDFAKLVAARQSDRKFDPERQIPVDVLERILDAARLAPSACNSQPWTFIVVTNPARMRTVADGSTSKLLGMNSFARQAPVQIVVVEEKPNLTAAIGSKLKNQPYTNYDIGIAVAHLVLAAEAEGVGSCILGWIDDKKIRQALDIPSNKRVVLNIVLGYSLDKKRAKKRKKLKDIVRYDSW